MNAASTDQTVMTVIVDIATVKDIDRVIGKFSKK
jgi:hypothetical protein